MFCNNLTPSQIINIIIMHNYALCIMNYSLALAVRALAECPACGNEYCFGAGHND